MDWLLIGIGVVLFGVFGWYLHRRFGAKETLVHRPNSPEAGYDAGEVAKATFIGIPPSR